jgi:hypothetical protein
MRTRLGSRRAIAACSVIGLGWSAGAQCVGGDWSSLAAMQTARQEVGAAEMGGRVYVVGGLLNGFVNTSTVEVYEIATNRWSGAAAMPEALDHPAVAAVTSATGGSVYVIGGYAGAARSRSDRVYRLDTGSGQWSAVRSLPQPRAAAWAVEVNGFIHVVGGDGSGGARNTHYRYDPTQDVWETRAPMPTAREHLNAAAVGGIIYVIGGRTSQGSFNVNERYDIASDRWATMATMPTARSAMAMSAVGGKIYAMGGEIPRLFGVAEVYDTSANRWACIGSMALPRHGIHAVTIGDGLIMCPAGGIVQGLDPTSRVDALRVCVADLDDGTGSPTTGGRPDNAVTLDDLVFFLGCYELGGLCADVDDGSGTARADGAVTLDDLLYFIRRYTAGC